VGLRLSSFLVRNLQPYRSMRDLAVGNIVKVEVVKGEPPLEALMAAYTEADSEAVREEAFRELHRRLAPKLYSHLLRLSRNPALAEDLLQVTFAKLHRARTTYLPGAKVMPWALVIARRTFLDECRGLAAQREVLGADGVLPERKSDQPSPDHVADMRRALDRLPDHYRSAIQLTKLIGFSGEEAAGLLSTTQAAIKLRVHRGYAMLRNILTGSPAPA
jgi:RNA polymerase sigma-70 factor (ECF subfamily)